VAQAFWHKAYAAGRSNTAGYHPLALLQVILYFRLALADAQQRYDDVIGNSGSRAFGASALGRRY
jgi:hypothetical protein